MKVPTGSSAEIEYPGSDGQPMSENQWQLDAMIDAINVLRCCAVTLSGSTCAWRTRRCVSMIRRRERIFSPTGSSRRSSGISEHATPGSNSATGCRPTRLLERFFLEGFFPTMRNWRRSSGT